MKIIQCTFSLLIALLIFCSCEDFRDHNGDFGGMWQLVEWKVQNDGQETATIKATNADGIYYSIHRNLIQFTHCLPGEPLHEGYSNRLLGYIEISGNLLTIKNVVYNYDDQFADSQKRNEYGIPDDGIYTILSISNEKLVLRHGNNTLTFRKY